MRTRAGAGNRGVAATGVGLAGWHHCVKQGEYDAAITGLRADDAAMRSDLDNLKSQLDSRFSAYDAKISQLQGRVRVDLAAHFDYDKAGLRDADKPAPDDIVSEIGRASCRERVCQYV